MLNRRESLGKPDAVGAMRVVLRIEVEGVPEQRKGLGCAWTKFFFSVEKISYSERLNELWICASFQEGFDCLWRNRSVGVVRLGAVIHDSQNARERRRVGGRRILEVRVGPCGEEFVERLKGLFGMVFESFHDEESEGR